MNMKAKKLRSHLIGHKDDFITIGHDGKYTPEQIKKDKEFMKIIDNLPDSFFKKKKDED